MLTPPDEFEVKFIVARGKLFWGYADKRHRAIAIEHEIPLGEVKGGGHAYPKFKITNWYSHEFGFYNQVEVQKLLPDWDVQPSAYSRVVPGGRNGR